MAARREALRVAARAVEHRINADTSDHVGATPPCACGQPARYAGRRAKTFTSVLGALTLERAYVDCERCAAGFCPRDAALGVAGTALSPGVLRMVGLVGAAVSFEEGHELLRDLAGVVVPTKHVERAAEALGREIAADEQRVVEPWPADDPLAPTLYLGMDGTGVAMRASELRGARASSLMARRRRARSNSARSGVPRAATRRAPRCATPARSPTRRPSRARPAGRPTPPRRHSRARALREATRRGFDRAPRQAVLGDGAPWIWNVATEHFPDAIQIVDRFHAKHHLSDVGKAIYGATSPLGRAWSKARHDELDAGKLDALRARARDPCGHE